MKAKTSKVPTPLHPHVSMDGLHYSSFQVSPERHAHRKAIDEYERKRQQKIDVMKFLEKHK